jgi:hypothetical protein
VKNGDIRVLLVGESAKSFRLMKRSLKRRRCRCRTATSYEQAHRLVGEDIPDVVLSTIPPRPGAISSMTELLEGTEASFYYAYPVEDGCWWLPALRRGERCLGAPALRSREFTLLFDRVLAEIREGRRLAREFVSQVRPARGAKAPETVLFALEKAAS